jgi:hypothetical protein
MYSGIFFLLELRQHRLVGAAMGGSPEAGDAGRDAGEGVGARGARKADRGRRSVLLMVRVQDEDAVHGLGQHRVHLVLLARHAEGHVEEVLGVVQRVPRIHEGLADRVLVGHGRDRRHLRDEAVGRDQPLLRILDVGRVVIEGGKGADHAHHDRHGMRVAAEPLIEPLQLLVDHRVAGDVVLELLLLRRRGKLSEQQEVADLHEVAVLRQVLDAVAAVEQHALVAVDIGDGGLAARRGSEARIVRKVGRLRVELADVEDGRTHRAVDDRQIDASARPVVRDGDRVAGSRPLGGRCLAHFGNSSNNRRSDGGGPYAIAIYG